MMGSAMTTAMKKRKLLLMIMMVTMSCCEGSSSKPKDVILDTDVDIDDVFALLYLLKQPRSLINLKAVTITPNAWTNAGHAVNQIYDVLYMMGRDDIPLGIGGEGGINSKGRVGRNVGGYLPLIDQYIYDFLYMMGRDDIPLGIGGEGRIDSKGRIDSNVGGYLVLSDQGVSTTGGCRYRQAIPLGSGGLLDVDTMYGLRKQFLPQGKRHYMPLKQPTAQEVILQALQSGPTVVLLIGSHTNFAITLMTHPEVKKNIEHIYIMGGGVNSSNPNGCCPEGSNTSCTPAQCGIRGNLFTAYESNPWAEFNIFCDPFAAYQVFHSGIPTTLVSLDATNTIPITENFFSALKDSQDTFEAQYVYQALKMTKDTWFDDEFFKSYFMWDSLAAGVTVSGIKTGHNMELNEFVDFTSKNLTVVTSNKPYGVEDGSNPFFSNQSNIPKFNLQKNGVHSGHVQTGVQDPVCFVSGGKGKCMDGYTMQTNGSDGVSIRVSEKAKPNPDPTNKLEHAFYKSFIDSLNDLSNTARHNFTTEFSCYKEVLYLPKYQGKSGKPVIFDMDMSPGDFITLLYLLKLPRDQFDLKAVTVTATGWANAATIDVVYDILHMMGRDDIPVGLGEFFAFGEAYPPFNSTGDCKYKKAVPHGAGGLIDSDTLFGLARDLPRSPRRYTAHNSVKFGAPRDTDNPSLRQPKASEVVSKVISSLEKYSKLTILTGGPLTNIAALLAANATLHNFIEEVYVAGGSIEWHKTLQGRKRLGNVFTVPQNWRAELNFFLDPIAVQNLLHSTLNITFVPLAPISKSPLLGGFMNDLQFFNTTPESAFTSKLLQQVHVLQRQSKLYSQAGERLGEVLVAAVMAHGAEVKSEFKVKPISVSANGDIRTDGWTKVDYRHGKPVRYVTNLDSTLYYSKLLHTLNEPRQSAVVASFADQKSLWNTCTP